MGCPNRSNPFHECSAYCARRWGTSSGLPPLPPGWLAVREKESGDTYYWLQGTDKTQWERPPPPAHTQASREPAKAAVVADNDEDSFEARLAALRKARDDGDFDKPDAETEASEAAPTGILAQPIPQQQATPVQDVAVHERCWKCGRKNPLPNGMCNKCARSMPQQQYIVPQHTLQVEQATQAAGGGKMRRAPGGARRQPYPPRSHAPGEDPMDVSAYSDAPKGTWASGMGREKPANQLEPESHN